MSKWMLKRKSADYETLSRELSVDPLIIRLLLNRNINTLEEMREYLYGDGSSIYNYSLLGGVLEAGKLLKDKIASNAKLRIVGDYDVDGVCATAILLKGLKFLGANVDHYIPNRFTDGYGLNVSIIEKAREDGVDTIITCDNGIAAFSQVAHAKEYGMTVIITDHHEVPFEEVEGVRKYLIPEADIVIDPKLPDDEYPFKEICGAYVAFKLMISLIDDESLIDELLQYAALATVADVMDIVGENRILLKQGLKLINSKPTCGLAALIQLNKLDVITSYHFGFILGPSINAAGRLDDAEYALSLLMENDADRAREYAEKLKELNDSRKSFTEEYTAKAIELIESTDIINQKVIVAPIDGCHEGVIGIVAGRLKEKYNRPVLVVTVHEGVYKGSGRSIEQYNLYEEMNKIADLFIKFGGHKGAAGFSFEINKLEEIREALNSKCSLTDADLEKKFYIDADVPFSYCTMPIVESFDIMEPFGNGNETLVFARNHIRIISAKFFGQDNMVGKYKIIDDTGKNNELTLFRRNDEFHDFLADKYGQEEADKLFAGNKVDLDISIAYYPKINEYNGYRNVQFIVIDYK